MYYVLEGACAERSQTHKRTVDVFDNNGNEKLIPFRFVQCSSSYSLVVVVFFLRIEILSVLFSIISYSATQNGICH